MGPLRELPYEATLPVILVDPRLDAVIVLFVPPVVGAEEVAAAVRAAVDGMETPVLAVVMTAEAAIELHGTIGPSRTTLGAVAERAGVERRTSYRHSPTEADLFAACSTHYFDANPWPDLDS